MGMKAENVGLTGPKLVTAEQMRRVDELSIEVHDIPGHELMDRAGARVVEQISARWSGLEGLRIVVVCGKGNNGGDGLVVARLLRQSGVDVVTYLLEPESCFGTDARIHAQRLRDAGIETQLVQSPAELELATHDLIVDAILGTGIRGSARPREAAFIEVLNLSGLPIVAIDLPSGLDADTGVIDGAAIKASLTVTFDLPKIAHLFYPARELCGALALTEIGFPAAALDACPSNTHLLTSEQVGGALPRRSAIAHKGTCGSVGVIAGSAGMTGAAALAAQAALRAGAGRVRVGCPSSLHDILEVKVTEAMTHCLPEVRRRRCLALRGLGETLDLVGTCDAIAIGPGLGRHHETMELVRRVLQSPDLPPVVVDADALYALGQSPGVLKTLGTPVVLTPHVGEMARLSGITTQLINQEPMHVARRVAKDSGAVVLLKGAPTVIADPTGTVFVSPTGNAGMASAGAGDVLAGVIAALLAQGSPALEAASLGAYLHGLSGDLGRDELGEWGLTATDIVTHLPHSFLETRRVSVRAD